MFGVWEKRATRRIFGLKICKKQGAGLIQGELHHFFSSPNSYDYEMKENDVMTEM